MERPQLHNVTLYVERPDLERTRDFYLALFDGESVWEEPGHIACVGTEDLALCVHEAEAGHAPGTREFFFRSQDLERVAANLLATGASLRRSRTAGGEDELHSVDPAGNTVRVHAEISPVRKGAGPGINVLVPVSNVRQSVAFYSELLGLADGGTSDDLATLRAAGAVLWLHREQHIVERAGVELWIGVEDVDAVHERLLASGLDDLRRPGDVAAWGLRVTSAPDPDGRRVYCFAPLLPAADRGSPR